MFDAAAAAATALPETDASPSQKVVATLLEWIESGVVRPGCRVPSARKLAQDLNVDKGTVLRAYDQLIRLGRLERTASRRHQVPDAVPAPSAVAAAPAWLEKTAFLFANPLMGDRPVQDRHRSGWSNFLETGVHEALLDAGYHALLMNPDALDGAQGPLHDATPPACGAIVTKSSPNGGRPDPHLATLLKTLHAAGRPVVVYGDNPEWAAYDRVVPDHRAGVRALTRRLFALGARRPVLLESRGIADWYWAQNRRAGYADAWRELGREPPPVLVMDDEEAEPNRFPNRREAFEYRAALMAGGLAPAFLGAEPPDALLCVTDGHVFAMAAACRKLGRDPGRDVLIAGYDNYWPECSEMDYAPFTPALTVDKNNRDAGRTLVRLYLAPADGDAPRVHVHASALIEPPRDGAERR